MLFLHQAHYCHQEVVIVEAFVQLSFLVDSIPMRILLLNVVEELITFGADAISTGEAYLSDSFVIVTAFVSAHNFIQIRRIVKLLAHYH